MMRLAVVVILVAQAFAESKAEIVLRERAERAEAALQRALAGQVAAAGVAKTTAKSADVSREKAADTAATDAEKGRRLAGEIGDEAKEAARAAAEAEKERARMALESLRVTSRTQVISIVVPSVMTAISGVLVAFFVNRRAEKRDVVQSARMDHVTGMLNSEKTAALEKSLVVLRSHLASLRALSNLELRLCPNAENCPSKESLAAIAVTESQISATEEELKSRNETAAKEAKLRQAS